MKNVKIILPNGALGASCNDDLIESFIRKLSEKHKNNPGDWAEKYGTDFENEKFKIHPFCWCEQDDCEYCNGTEPNFRYKPFDFEVSWYKYIGRGMEYNKKLTDEQISEMIKDCL